jgi:Zn finger protein HypA/HybF involved in hydrogenase expression
MNTKELMIAERAQIDMLCDSCQKEITEGEDFYYDHEEEEVYCERCASQKDNFSADYLY